MNRSRPRLALTAGEPAGIGPDLCAMLAQQAATSDLGCDITCLIDATLYARRSAALGLPSYPDNAAFHVEHHPLAVPAVAGRLDIRNAPAVLTLLDRAVAGCKSGEFAAMVTAPLQKSVINDAGIRFTGHTEYLAAACNAPRPVMLLVSEQLKVALATTHLPLRDVSAALTPALLDETLRILHSDLRRLWRVEAPRIAVCGLNPHAGESGHLGREEIDMIQPAIARARAAGIAAFGPLPADTVFVPRQLAQFDVVLAMYHDQGLPTLKYAGFGRAVNVTLGLPVLRTSVDHGTALDLAGTGKADCGSLQQALLLAGQLARSAT